VCAFVGKKFFIFDRMGKNIFETACVKFLNPTKKKRPTYIIQEERQANVI
jgi:hypothetical protein